LWVNESGLTPCDTELYCTCLLLRLSHTGASNNQFAVLSHLSWMHIENGHSA